MNIADIMTTDLFTLGMDSTVADIKLAFDTRGFHHVPILRDGTVVGIVSDRDVLRQISPLAYTDWANEQALKTLEKKAHQIMSRQLKTVRPDTGIKAAATAMLAGGVSCLLVTSEAGDLLGIVTSKDLLGYFIQQRESGV
ncbi:CBS domain-containing protein [Planctomycetota bacterium]